jgi:hypothetical protein
MNLVLITSILAIAAAVRVEAQDSLTALRISVVNHANNPIAFVKVDVKTPNGKAVKSGFTTAKGATEFHLADGAYMVSVSSTDTRNCLDFVERESKYVCVGQAPVSLKRSEAAVIVVLHPLLFP